MLTLYNVLGERISVLHTGMQEAGYHEVPIDVHTLPAGVYFCRLETGNHTVVQTLYVQP